MRRCCCLRVICKCSGHLPNPTARALKKAMAWQRIMPYGLMTLQLVNFRYGNSKEDHGSDPRKPSQKSPEGYRFGNYPDYKAGSPVSSRRKGLR